jgi:multidrug efflux pump subunit AcrB
MGKDVDSFFSFWIKNYRVSFLVAFLIFATGLFSLYKIPKESSPDIKFGIILISTIYPGVSPTDMDNLITDKIEKEIQDLDGIKKISSTSGVGISSITVELDNGVNTRDMTTDIKDNIDKITFPEDAQDVVVQEISTTNELMFQALLYGDESKFDSFTLNSLAKKIQKQLEGKGGIVSIDVGAGVNDGPVGWGWGATENYDIKVLLSQQKIELLGLTLQEVSSQIRAYNRNTPIGNYTMGELNYDFRFDGELTEISQLENLIIRDNGASRILLKDIAVLEKTYGKETVQKIGFYETSGFNYISLDFNKKPGSNIFSVSRKAKIALSSYIENNPEMKGLQVAYVRDLSDTIKDDYKQLSNNGIQTLVFVFIIVFLFIGIRESFIASLLIILSFAVTFTALDTLGRSLNFLTNFSLILSFGIAVDTLTVIIEGAVQKQKLWYKTTTAVLLAIKELKSSLITGTFATLFAFLPMIFLPGIIWKFLSYIPITTFFMLWAALFISLTLAAAFFIKFSKDLSFYFTDHFQEELLTPEEKIILDTERVGKKNSQPVSESRRLQFLWKFSETYFSLIERFMRKKKFRLIGVFGPIVLLLITFIFLSPIIGFTLFPQSDEGQINITIDAQDGTDDAALARFLPQIDAIISKYSELKVYFSEVSGNSINVYLELLPLSERKSKNMKSAFDIEEEILESFKTFESQWLSLAVKAQWGGPPSVKPVGIKLIVDDSKQVDLLREVAGDFEDYLRTLPGLKNIALSSTDSPGQFIFRFDNEKLSFSGLTPSDIVGEVYSYINGTTVGTIKSTLEDNDIVVKIWEFDDALSPEDVMNLQIQTKIGSVRLWDYVDYNFEKSLSSISRENGNISITVDADVEAWIVPTTLQPQLIAFAEKYTFPKGVSFLQGWENEENKELIVSTLQSFFIALFLIFAILVFQFNSYSQPLMILYSAILSIGGVNIGLFLTGNPYSMPFAIGFISLLGILVNNSIILIETINSNLQKVKLAKGGYISEQEYMYSIISAGTSRLQAIIITLVINLVGILPLALQDPFWAGLGFTIVFGLMAGTFLTLFSIPSLFYMVYYRRYVKKT